jgi:hypothetical protein
MQNPIVADLLWRALAIFLLIGALMGTGMALLLIFTPHLIKRVNLVANHWISMRQISQWLDRSVRTERWFYRHHLLLGPLVVLGACYMLLYFGMYLDQDAALRALGSYVTNQQLGGILLQALVLVALISAVLALLIGMVYWIRPSVLRGVETQANQWVSSRQATRVMDVTHDMVDEFVEHHAQRVGWLLLSASIYLFIVMLRWLLMTASLNH